MSPASTIEKCRKKIFFSARLLHIVFKNGEKNVVLSYTIRSTQWRKRAVRSTQGLNKEVHVRINQVGFTLKVVSL